MALNMINNSLEAIGDDPHITYIGISKDLDSGKDFTLFYGNASVNVTNDKCPNISWDDISLWPLIAFISVALIGMFLCFLGYRFLRAAVFIVSATITSGLVYVVCCEVVASTLPPLVVAGSSLLSGILAGLISILLVSCFGSRMTCLAAGVIFATYLLTVLRILFQFPLPASNSFQNSAGFYRDDEVPYEEENQTINYFSKNLVANDNGIDLSKIFPSVVSLVSMAFCGGAMLVASFLRPKATLILSTSIVGAVMIGLSMDFFTDREMNLARLSLDCLVIKVSLTNQFCQTDRCCWLTWAVLSSITLMIIVMSLFQWFCSSSGVEHKLDKLGLVSCGSNDRSCTSGRQAVPVLMEPSEKYRHLYRIRRTNGDIISRTHMEAIEVRKSNPSLVLTAARSNSDVVTTTDDDATLVLTQTLEE